MEYVVSWTVVVDAPNPQAAAEQAREMQLDEGNTASVFEINGAEYDAAPLCEDELCERRDPSETHGHRVSECSW